MFVVDIGGGPCFMIDTGTLSSKSRGQLCGSPNDLPLQTPASPNNVSGMIDFTQHHRVLINLLGTFQICHPWLPCLHDVFGTLQRLGS